MSVTTVQALAAQLGEHLAATFGERLRVAADWYSRARKTSPEQVASLVAHPPETTGDRRWDALLAGLVEQMCLERGVGCPRWVFSSDRFLDTWWFLSPYASVHPSAFVETPAALANHGVFVHAADLESL